MDYPPGPEGPSQLTVVTLEDNAAGHAAGWNPPVNGLQLYTIQSPVELRKGTLIELSLTNPSILVPLSHEVGECQNRRMYPTTDSFTITCDPGGFTPVEESTLTYIITNP